MRRGGGGGEEREWRMERKSVEEGKSRVKEERRERGWGGEGRDSGRGGGGL